MNYMMRDPRHEFTTTDNRERAEQLVRAGWPEMRRAYYGVREHLLAMQARHQAAGIRKTEANRRTIDAHRAKDDLVMRYRIAQLTIPDEELAPLNDEIQRCEESEAAADVELAAANRALGEARYVSNKVNNTSAEWVHAGVKLREKKVKIGRGDPDEALKAKLALQREAQLEVKRISGAGMSVPIIKERLAEQLDSLLNKDAFHLDYDSAEPRWLHPVTTLDAEHKLPGRVVATDDLLPLLMWLAGDDIRERLMERVDEDHRGDTRFRLDPEEKKKRLKKLRSDLLELQREEAALRVLIAGSSGEIAFPPDMAVEAILGVETY